MNPKPMVLKTIPLKHHLWILFAVSAMTIPFLDKAVHIDDTIYIYAARQILQDPLRPFDFAIDWLGTSTRAIDSLVHPPLFSYYLSLPMAILGESEQVLHGSLILFPLMAAYSMYSLTRRFAHRPLEATLLLLFAPPVFVAASSIMLDLPGLACVLTATAIFVAGLDSGRKSLLAGSGLLLGAAFLIKEGAALQYAFLGFYAFQRGRIKEALLPLGIACALPAGWIVFNFLMTGELLPALTGGWFVTLRLPMAERIVTLTGYLGGSVLILGCFLPPDKWRTGAGLGLLIACVLFLIHPGRGLPGFSKILFLLILLNGAFLLVRAATVLRNRDLLKDPDSQFLLLWLAFPLAFVLMVVSYNAMRHMLMFLPALILLLFRTGAPGPRFKTAIGANLILLAFLSHGISIGDYHYSDSYRKYANVIARDIRLLNPARTESGPSLWFTGHWGFQYYMDKNGGQILGMDRSGKLREGDWVVDLDQGHKNFLPALLRSRLQPVKTYHAESPWPFRTMHRPTGAGWYAEMWGPLPFSLAPGIELETFSLYRIGNP
ncbi:hypothetical protein UZ36_05570 [Candidatus Nitromaritima sp. SCGC AAA799-C22]|nr:hypothetical protein UZ36_05570 [Candidatus Nitromaritima sp. SCGC AAA799-C22]